MAQRIGEEEMIIKVDVSELSIATDAMEAICELSRDGFFMGMDKSFETKTVTKDGIEFECKVSKSLNIFIKASKLD